MGKKNFLIINSIWIFYLLYIEKDEKFKNKKRKSDKKKQNEKIKPSKEEIEEKNKKKNKAGWDNIINFTKELKNEKFEFYYKTQLSEYFTT